jgi:hypothetical protein
MSKRSEGSVWKSFQAEVEEHFGPLEADLGLEGAPVPERVAGVKCVAYRSPLLTYRVCLVQEDHGVFTAVHLAAAERTLVARLEKLVPATGLGSRQDVPTSAHTLYSLRRSLSAQAGWVRSLHPTLEGPDAAELMQRAGARARPVPRPEE